MNSFHIYFFFSVLGLCFGSFYNVCISRIPKDESIAKKRSHCPNCGYILSFFDLIPVISYLFLMGKCRKCGERISFRYPMVEVLTALLLIFMIYNYGFSIKTGASFIFFSILIIISFIDIENLVIPDGLVLLGVFVAVIYHFFFGKGLLFPFLGALVGLIFFYGLTIIGKYLMKKDAVGEGDTKLAIMLGAFLGMEMMILSVFFGSIFGLMLVVLLMGLKKIKRNDYLPFGSFLAVGAFFAFVYGRRILSFFLDFN